MINLTINNIPVSVSEGTTILEAAKQNKIDIPHLCYLEGIHQFGSCRLCVVEVEGVKKLQASCMTEVQEGMVVQTNTPKVRKVRKNNYELLLSNHPKDCPSCENNKNCELQDMGVRLGVTEARFSGEISGGNADISAFITRDPAKCILCRRCVTACNAIQNVGILNAQNRGFQTRVSTAMDLPIETVNCTACGQCTAVCPTGAIKETDGIQKVWDAIGDPSKRVVVQLAPEVGASIGEVFGASSGESLSGQLIAGLRQMGFTDVFNTGFAADLMITEQTAEFLTQLKNQLSGKQILPMVSSCSPGFIKYAEHAYPDCLEALSACKSPDAILGTLVKTVQAEKLQIDPNDVYVVVVSPCIAKKYEITRPEMQVNGLPNIDAVLTTRELIRMIQEAGVDLLIQEESEFDQPFAQGSAQAEKSGIPGGFMEAVLQSLYEKVTKRSLSSEMPKAVPVPEYEQIKEIELKIENPIETYRFLQGAVIKAAVASGLRGAQILMDQTAKGESPYHFIDIMACPDGCVGGGGQPGPLTPEKVRTRCQALNRQSERKSSRHANDNTDIIKLYEDFLQEPNSSKAVELIHARYTK